MNLCAFFPKNPDHRTPKKCNEKQNILKTQILLIILNIIIYMVLIIAYLDCHTALLTVAQVRSELEHTGRHIVSVMNIWELIIWDLIQYKNVLPV